MLSNWADMTVRSRQVELDISEQVDPMRDIVASSIANGWLDRVSHHVNRIALHIQKAVLASGK